MKNKKYLEDLTLENKTSKIPDTITSAKDIQLNGFYTKIRRISIFDKELTLPENFSIVYNDLEDNGMYALDEKVIPTSDYSDNCEFYVINLNPKLVDFIDLGFDGFFEVQNNPKYYDFFIGNCTSIFIKLINRKVSCFYINYVYRNNKEIRNESIYIDWD